MCCEKGSLYIEMDVVLLGSSTDLVEFVTFLPVECFPGCLLSSSLPDPGSCLRAEIAFFFIIILFYKTSSSERKRKLSPPPKK